MPETARRTPSRAARWSFAGVRGAGLCHCWVAKPADAVLNTAVWQGEAPLPLDPLDFRAAIGAAESASRLQNLASIASQGLSDGDPGQDGPHSEKAGSPRQSGRLSGARRVL